jgi:hypothetical protein
MQKGVYIVNHAGYDYEAAKTYGNLVFLTKGYIDLKEQPDVKDQLRSLIESATAEDYLLLSGNNLLCVAAFDLWKSIHGKVNILHWSNRKYDEYQL